MKAETLQTKIKEIDHELNSRKVYNSPLQLRIYRKLRTKLNKQLEKLPPPPTTNQLKLL